MAQEQRPRQSRSLGPDPEATAPPQPALTVPTDVTRNRSARRHPAKAGPHETVAPPGFRSRRPALSPRKRSRMEHSERCARLGPQHHRIGREIERVLVAHLDGDGSRLYRRHALSNPPARSRGRRLRAGSPNAPLPTLACRLSVAGALWCFACAHCLMARRTDSLEPCRVVLGAAFAHRQDVIDPA